MRFKTLTESTEKQILYYYEEIDTHTHIHTYVCLYVCVCV